MSVTLQWILVAVIVMTAVAFVVIRLCRKGATGLCDSCDNKECALRGLPRRGCKEK